MKKISILSKPILVAALFAMSLTAMASEIGRVVNLRGEVIRVNHDKGISGEALKAGARLYEGDQINSSERSFARILMKDETIFQVGPETTFEFEKFDFKAKNERQASYNLVNGRLRSLITQPAGDNDLTINTPTASMGIRGTEILSDVYLLDGEVRTDIALLSGRLDVMAGAVGSGERAVVSLQPGQVFEAARGMRDVALSESRVTQLPRQMMDQLRVSEGRGGHTFLFDARSEQNPRLRETASFDVRQDREPAPAERSIEQRLENQPQRIPAGETEQREVPTREIDRDGANIQQPRTIEPTREFSSNTKDDPISRIEGVSRTSEDRDVFAIETKPERELEGLSVVSEPEPIKRDFESHSVDDGRLIDHESPTKVSTIDDSIKVDRFTEPTRDFEVVDTKIDSGRLTTIEEPTLSQDMDIKRTFEPVSEPTTVYEPVQFRDVKYESEPTFEVISKPTRDISSINEPVLIEPVVDTSTTLIDNTVNTIDATRDVLIQAEIADQDRTLTDAVVKTTETTTTIVNETTKTLDKTVDTVTSPVRDLGGGLLRR